MEDINIFELTNISYSYKMGEEVLKGVSTKIKAGERVCVIGLNGSGKTTLLKHLNGLLKPSSGQILYCGERIKYKKDGLRELRRKVGFVFQDPDIHMFGPTVYEEVAFGPHNLGYSSSLVKEMVEDALKRTNIKELSGRLIHKLSYGEKKRVCIASVISMGSEVIVFDEPTVFLDEVGKQELYMLLDKLHIEGKTLIFSTHNMDFAYAYADKFLVLDGGQIVGKGDIGDIFASEVNENGYGLKLPYVAKLFHGLRRQGMLSWYDVKKEGLPRTEEEVWSLASRYKV